MTEPTPTNSTDEDGMLDAADVTIVEDPNFVPEEVLPDDDAESDA